MDLWVLWEDFFHGRNTLRAAPGPALGTFSPDWLEEILGSYKPSWVFRSRRGWWCLKSFPSFEGEGLGEGHKAAIPPSPAACYLHFSLYCVGSKLLAVLICTANFFYFILFFWYTFLRIVLF